MADEPNNLVLRLLRDIRNTQDVHGVDLKYLKERVDDLYKISKERVQLEAKA